MPKKLNTEEWINKAREIHGDTYDYSKVEYINTMTKVCIICNKHGEFWQTPNHHLQGNGCPICKGKNKTTESVIEEFIQIHGDRYDYSKVEYINNNTKVCIICPIHGEFYQSPKDHLRHNTYGCPKCGYNKSAKSNSLGTEKFIEKAKLLHGNKYDYSKVEYVNTNTKVCIICKKHGEFHQCPDYHLRGSGCLKCVTEMIRYNLTSNTKEFIEKAILIHMNKFDYSKVEYIAANTKVCIVCPIHGEFWQTPNNHLNGQGCKPCSYNKLRQLKQKTIEKFIEQAKEVHGNKFDYSKVKYINGKTKVCILCSTHGEFWQQPNNHLQGNGCPVCKESKLEMEINNYLINNNIEFESQKRFHWLCLQSLDFYLPKLNLAIECQGEQHFKSVNFFGGKTKFKETINRDIHKKQLCEEHGIKLLYYTNLTDYDAFLENKLIKSEEELLNKIKEYG